MDGKGYEFLEHTADICLRAYGKSLEQLFINAARGMFDFIADIGKVRSSEKITLQLKAAKLDELLIEWLRELLYQYNKTGIVFSEFSIERLTSTEIQAVVSGAKALDNIKAEIKAVTYHELQLRQFQDGYEAVVIFDV